MGFYSAHIAISNEHLFVFVSVASAYEEALVHRGFTAYRLAVHISLLHRLHNPTCWGLIGLIAFSPKTEQLVEVYQCKIKNKSRPTLCSHICLPGEAKPEQGRVGKVVKPPFPLIHGDTHTASWVLPAWLTSFDHRCSAEPLQSKVAFKKAMKYHLELPSFSLTWTTLLFWFGAWPKELFHKAHQDGKSMKDRKKLSVRSETF